MKGDDAPRDLDLSSPRHVHIVGIGGAGMSAIATVLARMGHHVTGSDLKESRGLDRLRLLGVRAAVDLDERVVREEGAGARAVLRGEAVYDRADVLLVGGVVGAAGEDQGQTGGGGAEQRCGAIHGGQP